jgi:hypothetical protein
MRKVSLFFQAGLLLRKSKSKDCKLKAFLEKKRGGQKMACASVGGFFSA